MPSTEIPLAAPTLWTWIGYLQQIHVKMSHTRGIVPDEAIVQLLGNNLLQQIHCPMDMVHRLNPLLIQILVCIHHLI
jgi:hypothetical protein